MPEIAWSKLLLYAAIGGVAGAGLFYLNYLRRDWEFVVHQWRVRDRMERAEDRYFEELRELEGYQPDAVSEEERAQLPRSLANAALIGAVIFGGFVSGSEVAMTVGLTLAGVISIIRALTEDRAPEVGVPTALGKDDEAKPSRM